MNLEQIISDLIKYKAEIIKRLAASYWLPYFLIREKFSNNIFDPEFKNCFCRFYIMNGPMGLNNFQKNEFFRLLSVKENDLEKILRTLYEIPGYGDSHKLFLSFGTKLLHTIDNDLPIYDRNIADVLELQNQVTGALETRIKNRTDIYKELINNFILLLKDQRVVDFLQDIRNEIHREYAQNNFEWKNNLVSDVKLLDSLLWALYTIRKESEKNQTSQNMEPKDYYHKNFRADFAEFMAKSKMAHQHPGEGVYIPIQDLNKKTISHLKTDPWHTMRFLYCLTFTILIDQVMYTYFKGDYEKFQSITLYPKIEYGITNMNARPWDIAQRAGGLTTFEKFADFFNQDFKEFFEKQNFPSANWMKVRKVMLNDKDVCSGSFGQIFCDKLRQS